MRPSLPPAVFPLGVRWDGPRHRSLSLELTPSLVQLPAELANASWRHLEQLGRGARGLARGQYLGHPPVLPRQRAQPRRHVDPGSGCLRWPGSPVLHNDLAPLAIAVRDLIQTLNLQAVASLAADRSDVLHVTTATETTSIANAGGRIPGQRGGVSEVLAPLLPQFHEGVHRVGYNLLDGLVALFSPEAAKSESRMASNIGQQFKKATVPVVVALGGSLSRTRT